jgi:hypothetical protein
MKYLSFILMANIMLINGCSSFNDVQHINQDNFVNNQFYSSLSQNTQGDIYHTYINNISSPQNSGNLFGNLIVSKIINKEKIVTDKPLASNVTMPINAFDSNGNLYISYLDVQGNVNYINYTTKKITNTNIKINKQIKLDDMTSINTSRFNKYSFNIYNDTIYIIYNYDFNPTYNNQNTALHVCDKKNNKCLAIIFNTEDNIKEDKKLSTNHTTNKSTFICSMIINSTNKSKSHTIQINNQKYIIEEYYNKDNFITGFGIIKSNGSNLGCIGSIN